MYGVVSSTTDRGLDPSTSCSDRRPSGITVVVGSDTTYTTLRRIDKNPERTADGCEERASAARASTSPVLKLSWHPLSRHADVEPAAGTHCYAEGKGRYILIFTSLNVFCILYLAVLGTWHAKIRRVLPNRHHIV